MTTPLKNSTVLLTRRLRLRAPQMSDLDFFIRLYSNSDVMKHIPPKGKPATTDEAEERLHRLIHHWKEHGYGMFVIERKDGNIPVGYCGLRFLPEAEQIELGYIIDQPHWGCGIAPEAAGACIQYARNTLKSACIISITNPDNQASQKILQTFGFKRRCEDDGVYHGMMHHFFIKEFSCKSLKNEPARSSTDTPRLENIAL